MCGRYALNISGDDLALEFAAGNANVAMMALIGIALVGVIFVSRYFRTVNK